MLLTAGEARNACLAALARHGVPPSHAALQTELLIDAELMGHASHGVQRLPRIIERIGNGVVNPATEGIHAWRTPALLEVDGEMGLGPVVIMKALEAAVERAAEIGVVLGAIRNSNHIGMLSWYVRRLAEDGHIAIVLTTSEALVHPYGGRAAMIGTNPIAIGVPAEPSPFVLDMASGIVSMGKIHDYANRGEPIPPHWALDAEGDPTTDAAAAKNGAIAPFGDAKGYGLGLAIEILVGSLTGCALGTDVKGTLDSENVCNKGDVFIVIDPANANAAASISAISAYLDAIRASAPADPKTPVTIPGDRALRAREARLASGIDVNDDIWRRILAFATPAGEKLA
jgi:LDH2 family malate/lactate/ureidoglycolate dehydrogenase